MHAIAIAACPVLSSGVAHAEYSYLESGSTIKIEGCDPGKTNVQSTRAE